VSATAAAVDVVADLDAQQAMSALNKLRTLNTRRDVLAMLRGELSARHVGMKYARNTVCRARQIALATIVLKTTHLLLKTNFYFYTELGGNGLIQ
jgi:hypothetical protein